MDKARQCIAMLHFDWAHPPLHWHWGQGQSGLFPGHCISKLSVKLTEGSESGGRAERAAPGTDTCWTSEHWDSVNLSSGGARVRAEREDDQEILHTWPEHKPRCKQVFSASNIMGMFEIQVRELGEGKRLRLRGLNKLNLTNGWLNWIEISTL